MNVKEFVEQAVRQIREGLEAGEAIPPLPVAPYSEIDTFPLVQARIGMTVSTNGGKLEVQGGNIDFNAQIEFLGPEKEAPKTRGKGKKKKS
jgi:hypothetical protein